MDKNNELKLKKLINNFTNIIEAIEFFSQKFSDTQILEYACDFLKSSLSVDKIIAYKRVNLSYNIVHNDGYKDIIEDIPFDNNYDMIALYHGTIIQKKNLDDFFTKDIVSTYNMDICIPLIVENKLYGFIFTTKSNYEFTKDDLIILDSLNKLFNISLYNYHTYKQLNDSKVQLDQKIFNLFAINQSSKILLSELDMDRLFLLSTDVFSELTQSSITSFFLYDDISEKYILKSMKNIFNPKQTLEIQLYINDNYTINPRKNILDMYNIEDKKYFKSIFQNADECLNSLDIHYVIMLLKEDTLLGFVSLSQNVMNKKYDTSMFELIESLSSSTFIALSNAKYFEKVKIQSNLLEYKFNNLISLNDLLKNINTSNSLERLLNILITTTEISFNIDCMLIALYDKDKDIFYSNNYTGIDTTETIIIENNPKFKPLFNGSSILSFEDMINNYFDKNLISKLASYQGSLIIPIYIYKLDLELIGFISLFNIKDKLISDDSIILYAETISNHIAPIMYNFIDIEKQKELLIPNYINIFKKDLHKFINEAENLYMDLYIVHLYKDFSFNDTLYNKNLSDKYENIYTLSNNNMFIISFYEIDIDYINSLYNGINIKLYKYKKDFNSYDEFIKVV